MYFDYKGWRVQLRDSRFKVRNVSSQLQIVSVSDAWYQHLCFADHPDPKLKKVRGRTETTPMLIPGKAMRKGRKRIDGHNIRWCMRCGAESPVEVLNYLSKAADLWASAVST